MKAQTVRRITLLSAMIIAMAAFFMLPACSTTSQMQKTSAIEQSMRDSYAYKTYLQKDNVLIKAKGDEVTLEGTVPEASHRFLAEDLARSTAGVKEVDNRLQVEGGTPRKGGDTELGAQVKARLMMHPDVNAAQTEVFVDKGVVTLRGQASTEAQRNLAAEYARNVKGVKDVVNAITVASAGGQGQGAQGISDTALAMKVKSALAANRSTGDLNPRIDSKGGVVIVHGTVNNQAQKDLVTQIVRGTQGVKDVANEMTVAGTTGAMSQGLDDSAITARAKAALDTNTSTSDLDVSVQTANGIVTVTGTADSQAQKDLVTRIVADINGVKGVNNDMAVTSVG